MRVAVVRHGQENAAFGSGDPSLSAVGREQAIQAARELRPHRWQALLSSPAARARETADIIAGELGLVASADPLFEELRPPRDIAERRSEWQRRVLDLRWEDVPAELRGWRDRVLRRIEEVTADTVIVTHFGVINAIVSTLTGSPAFFAFAPRTGSITRLAVSGKRGIGIEELGARKESAA